MLLSYSVIFVLYIILNYIIIDYKTSFYIISYNLALVNGLVCYTYGYKNQEHSLYHENEVRMVIMDVRDSYNHMCSTTAHWLKQLANKLIIVISNQFKIIKVNISI